MTLQRIIVIILILAGIGGAYYYFQVYSAAPASEGSSPAVAELDARLNEIRPLASVDLDTSVFNNIFFRSLQPAAVATTSAPAPGRINPFTPY